MQFVAPATTNTTAAGTSTDATGGLGSLLGSVLGTAANTYGAQNAAEDISQADQAAIGTQTQTLGNITSLYQPQTTLGNNSMTALGNAEGLNGAAPNYSGFENMPGYQFAVNQGTQAIQRQAAASGSAFTPNTLASVGQYVTGTAMQDYNTYIGQLQSNAQLGSAANQTLAGANLTTGGNISQLQQNSGVAQASGVSNAAGGISSFLNGGGLNTIAGAANGIANGITGGNGGVTGAISNWLNGSPTSGGSAANPTISYNPSTGEYSNGVMPGAGPNGTDYAPGVSTGDAPAGYVDPNASPFTTGSLSGDAGLGSDAASGAGSLATDAGGAGAAAAAADEAGLFGTTAPGAATTAANAGSYMDYISNLAQTGSASTQGVAGSIAASDTTAAPAAAGSLGLGLAGAAAVLGVAAYGASKPGTSLGSTWYNNLGSNVGAGMSQNATVPQKLQAVTALQTIASMANVGQGNSGLSTDNNFDTQRALQMLAPYGVTTIAQAQQLANNLLNSIPPGQMPGQSVGRGGESTVGVGNMSGYIKPE
jgi:hypothetical protein